MYNFVLSPIDPEILIDSIAEKVTANILNAVKKEQQPTKQQDELLTIKQASEFLNLSVQTLYNKVSKNEMSNIWSEIIEHADEYLTPIMKIVYNEPYKFLFINTDSQRLFNSWDEILMD